MGRDNASGGRFASGYSIWLGWARSFPSWADYHISRIRLVGGDVLLDAVG